MAELNKTNVALEDLSLPDGDSTISAASYSEGLDPSERSGSVEFSTDMLTYEWVGSTCRVTGIKDEYKNSATSITIPDYYHGSSVREIADNAFINNTVIQHVVIPNRVTKIGNSAFKGCTSLGTVYFRASDQVVVYFLNSLKWTKVYCYRSKRMGNTTVPINTWPGDEMILWGSEGGDDIYRLVIGRGADITFVGTNFYGEEESTSLVAESELIMNGCWEPYIDTDGTIQARTYYYGNATASLTLGTSVFEGCTSLDSITLPDTIDYLPDSAFSGCTSLTKVLFADMANIVGIGNKAFSGTKLQNISNTWPQTIRNIGEMAFLDCTELTRVYIPRSVIAIEHAAFAGCTGITEVTIDSTTPLTDIGKQAFFGCNSLETISIPTTVNKIGENAFSGCPLASVTMYDPYGWFDKKNDGEVAISYHDLKIPENAGDLLSTTYSKYKIDRLEPPTLSIDATTLYITDPTGMAETFEIWVGNSRWATVDADTGAVTLVKE